MKKVIFLLLSIIFLSFHSASAALLEKKTINLDEIVITASRMAQHNYKVAGNVTVINQEEIESSNAIGIADILKEELGINVYDNSSIKSAVVDIRGFGDTASRNVLILVNDRKVNTADISNPDLMNIPLDSVERIEIIRGAGSVLYGDNAVGGVVNIITKKGKGPLSGKIGSMYSSYDTFKENVDVSGSTENWKYYFLTDYYKTGGYRENSDLVSKNYKTRLDYGYSDKLNLDADIGWSEDDYRLPGGLNQTELETMGRRASANPDDYASSKDRYFKLAMDLNPWPEELDYGHLVSEFSYRNRDTYAWFDYGAFGATATKRSIDTFGLSSKYVFNKNILNRDVNFVTGLDFYDTTNDILGSGAGLSSSSDDLTISKDELGAFGYAEYEVISDVYLNAGGRYQKAYYTFDRRDTPFYDTKNPDVQVYMSGLRYDYSQGSNVHMNVQQTFRFLATDEWYDTFAGLNTDLEQQTGIQYEAGIKHNFHDKATFSVTPYWMDIKNEIFFDPVTVFFGKNSNYDKTRRRGVEVGLNSELTSWLEIPKTESFELFTNYTYQVPEFMEGSFEGKDIPMAPRHQATSGIHTKFFDRYQFSLSGTYVGSRFAINDTLNATDPIKPYFTLDTKVGVKIKAFDVALSANNLLNERYSTYVVKSSVSNVKDSFPAPERNFGVKVSCEF